MKKLLIYMLIIIWCIGTVLLYHSNFKDARAPSLCTTETIKSKFYDEKSFRRSISHATSKNLFDFDLEGGITPHHLLADDFIATFFRSVSIKAPEIVFVIAPNHKNVGNYKITTCYNNWETPFGLLKAAPEIVKALLNEEHSGINPKLMETDHSISSLIPYIKYYLPQTQLVPIMLKGDTSLETCTQLGNRIATLSTSKKTMIIASVDFSHYLSMDMADKMDVFTLDAIKARDFKKLRSMGNDNLDSPPSIITLLVAMNVIGAETIKELDHSNSDRISKADTGYTTSYFTMLFGSSIK